MDTTQFHSFAGARRVTRSFAFVDLCGFCDFADAEGDGGAAAELTNLRHTVRSVASHLSVRVDKWLGDGAMLVGVDVEPLVASVLAVAEVHRNEGRLAVRAGLACGEVLLLDGDDYVGRPVNLAARLCDQAGPGRVLAWRQGLRLPTWAVIEDKLTTEVRGFADPVRVASLAAREGALSGQEQPVLASLLDTLTQPVRALLTPRR